MSNLQEADIYARRTAITHHQWAWHKDSEQDQAAVEGQQSHDKCAKVSKGSAKESTPKTSALKTKINGNYAQTLTAIESK